jgi:RHS repeat-associated protein
VTYQREFTFKDHLGNLRLAYRAGQRRTYAATLEPDAPTHARESQQFDSLSVSPPIAVSTGLARTGRYAARLNAGGTTPHPLGPLTQLTVQKGDTLFVTAPGRYPQATNNNSFAFSLVSFVASLLTPSPGAPTGLDGSRRGGLPLLQVGLSSATLRALNQLPGGVPKGYLRVLSFNEDSVLVDQRTVQLSAAALGNYETLSTGPLLVQHNGYVSVYVGNESPADVYFDDLTIEHRQGLQVQENSYDPFGLDLAGVSSAAPGLHLKNFYQFNGKENQLDLGLNWNHQDWRFFDYQLGRWHVVDPEIENAQEAWTPYQFGFDNAVRFADADGRNPGGGFGGGFVEGFVGTFTGIRDAAVAAVQSPQAFASAVAGIAVEGQLPVMMYRAMQQTTAFGTAIAEGNSTETGRQAGGVAAQLTIAAVTEGASRAVGTVRGLARGTAAAEGADASNVRVRHYTSPEGAAAIRKDGAIIPSAAGTAPKGVHVEVGPNFGKANTGHAQTGAPRPAGKGAYVEFDTPKDALHSTTHWVSPTRDGVPLRNTGVVPTDSPLPIQGANPTYHTIQNPTNIY